MASLDQPADAAHANYDLLNDALRGRFAAAALRPLVLADRPMEQCLVALRQSRLTQLELNVDGYSASTTRRVLASLPAELQVLTLQGSNMSNEHAQVLAETLKSNSTVTEVDLFNNDFDDEGGVAIAEALQTNRTMASLNISGNYCAEATAIALGAALAVNGTLKKLVVGKNKDIMGMNGNIGDTGVVALSSGLKVNSGLTDLDLSCTAVGDIGINALGDALQTNQALTKLDISANEDITPEGRAALATALQMRNAPLTLLAEDS